MGPDGFREDCFQPSKISCCLGSGIFVVPALVLKGTGSVGVSILLWAIGALVAMASVLVWLEMGLSVPRFDVHGNEVSVPRSGGEKNYVGAQPWLMDSLLV